MKVIVQNFSPKHCMEVVEQKINDEKLKFKIVSSNGNCYSKLEVYILNNNGLQLIFEKEDIPIFVTELPKFKVFSEEPGNNKSGISLIL